MDPRTRDIEPINIEDVPASFSLGGFALIMLASLLGAAAAIWVLPNWIPGMAQSLDVNDPKVYWYLSRGSAFVAYLLLWLSMVLGVGISNKLAAIWPGFPPAIDLHQYTSILGLAFGLFHGLILIGDRYIEFTVVKVLLPFSSVGYKPLEVGIGQLGIYLWIIVTFTFYIRKKIGHKVWRVLHYGSFIAFLFALYHGITSGTDTSTLWAQIIYWVSGIILGYLIIYRVLLARSNAIARKNKLAGLPPDLPTA